MTLHNAKGLEFRAVFMIGMEEGPSRTRARSRSRGRGGARLCYVGMTRAMERLTLTHTLARTLFGRREYNLASRFSTSCRRRSSASACGPPRGARLSDRSGDRAATRHRARRATPYGTARSARASSPKSNPVGRWRSLRVGRDGTEADGGVRTPGEDRVSFKVKPCTNLEEFGQAVFAIGQYFGMVADRGAFGALLEEPADRAHARRARERHDRRRRCVRSSSPFPAARFRRRASPSSARSRRTVGGGAASDDACAARRRACARRACRAAVGLRGHDLRSLRLRHGLPVCGGVHSEAPVGVRATTRA